MTYAQFCNGARWALNAYLQNPTPELRAALMEKIDAAPALFGDLNEGGAE